MLGYLDEVILLPLAIAFALRLIPESVLAEARARAELSAERPKSRTAAVIIVLLWLGATALFGLWAYQALT